MGICRLQGKKPLFLCHAVVCVTVSLLTVGQYRVLSASPQVLDYAFSMSAMIALMLASYQMAAFDAGMGDHRKLWASALSAGYLCLAGAYGSAQPLFAVLCAVWMFTNLTNLKRHRRPAPPQQEEAAP